MDLPVDPIRMTVDEILANLEAGHREVVAIGPEAALAYLQRILRDTIDLPHEVRMVVYDLISEAQAELQDWDGCSASMALALEERRLARAQAAMLAPASGPDVPAPLKMAEEPPDLDAFFSRPVAAPQPEALPAPRGQPAESPLAKLREMPAKFCCACGKDVSHKARLKDPISKTYLCRECFDARSAVKRRQVPALKPVVLWVVVLSLLAVGTLILLRL